MRRFAAAIAVSGYCIMAMADAGFELDLTLQIGKYEVQKALGKGATGTVYLAVDTFTNRVVALKTIEPEVFRDPEFGAVLRSQFLNEASLAGKLKHPHIVTIYDAVVEENSGHIAMELVTGGDLSQHARPDCLLPICDVLQIGFKCCGALDYAFREGIVHRDIKPANIMINQGTNVKIADFGSAFLRKSEAVQTVAMGSPFYMSPEQIDGKELTLHSDMYALGVVLYELLTGYRPLVANDLGTLAVMIRGKDPAPPSRLRADLPRQFDEVILRALCKKPEHRYPTWGDFARTLSALGSLVLPPGAIADSEKFVTLQKVEMLANLSDAEIWEMVNAGNWSRVARGATLIRENEPGASFFFLARGQAKVVKNGRLLNMIGESECFGEMAYISGGKLPRHANVEAMSDLLLAEFDPIELDAMSLSTQLQLTRALVRNLADRLQLANSRLTG